MKTKPLGMLVLALLAWSAAATAAPSVKIIRIDPTPVVDGNSLTLRMVVDLGEPRSSSGGLAECGPPSKKFEYLSCAGDILEKPNASYAPIPWPPAEKVDAPPNPADENSHVGLMVGVDGAEMPAELVGHTRWEAQAKTDTRFGTSYLILVDASNTMGPRLETAKAAARAFIEARGKNDIYNVKSFNDATWFAGSGWTNDPAVLDAAISAISLAPEAPGRSRPLFDLIKNSALEGFSEIGNRAQKVATPLHHALVVFSDGWAGTDFGGSAPALALELGNTLASGILDEHNLTAPRMPIPVISGWTPAGGIEEAFENARQFMRNLAVPSVGGGFYMLPDRGAERGATIAKQAKKRFNDMHVLEWKVPCLAAGTSQTFKLFFRDEKKPILGDGWGGVTYGVDPRTWPLAVDVEATKRKADREPAMPGGTATIFGRFCWGNNHERAEIYLVPKNQPLPDGTASDEDAKRARDDLTAKGMRATPIRSSDNYVEVLLPDSELFLNDGSARLIVVDGMSKRASPADQAGVLAIKAQGKSTSGLMIVAFVFAGVVVVLLLVNLLRGGGGGPAGRRRQTALPAPVVASSGAAADLARSSASLVPPVPPPTPSPLMPQAVSSSTVMFSAVPAAGGVQRARLGGAAGVFPIVPGREFRVGRGEGCDIPLQEPRVSSSHAKVKIENGQLLVWDEGSENGTFLNGSRVGPRAWTSVAHGAVLRFGAVDLMVQLE